MRALVLEPDQPLVLNYLGYSMVEKKENLDEALAMIEKAVKSEPEDGYITDSLGWLFYQRGLKQLEAGQRDAAKTSFNAARTQLEHALELLEQDDPVITWHLGDAYRSLARYEEALATYQRALSLEPKDADVYVDGVLQGIADDFDGQPRYLKVEPGLRRVELRKAGLKTWRMELQMAADGRQTITAKLSP